MYKNVSFLSGLMNKISSSLKVHAQVIVLMVLARNVQSKGDMLFWMFYMNVFAGCQDGSDLIAFLTQYIRWRVSMFYADSRLPRKMPPLLLWGS